MSRVVRPLKNLGQHFLTDLEAARSMVERAGVGPEDHVLEIGPGEGVLTEFLLETEAQSVTAVEVDDRLAPWLIARFSRDRRFTLIQDDILKVDLTDLFSRIKPWRVFGNLPYSITTPILFRMLEHRHMVRDVTVTIQKEVAERLASPPGCKAYGIPSVLFQLYSRVELLFHIPRSSFFPVPGVDSSVLQIEFLENPRYELLDPEHFNRLVKTAFGQRRKMLRNSIKSMVTHTELSEKSARFLTRRPEELSVEEWADLSNQIVKSDRL